MTTLNFLTLDKFIRKNDFFIDFLPENLDSKHVIVDLSCADEDSFLKMFEVETHLECISIAEKLRGWILELQKFNVEMLVFYIGGYTARNAVVSVCLKSILDQEQCEFFIYADQSEMELNMVARARYHESVVFSSNFSIYLYSEVIYAPLSVNELSSLQESPIKVFDRQAFQFEGVKIPIINIPMLMAYPELYGAELPKINDFQEKILSTLKKSNINDEKFKKLQEKISNIWKEDFKSTAYEARKENICFENDYDSDYDIYSNESCSSYDDGFITQEIDNEISAKDRQIDALIKRYACNEDLVKFKRKTHLNALTAKSCFNQFEYLTLLGKIPVALTLFHRNSNSRMLPRLPHDEKIGHKYNSPWKASEHLG